MITFLSLELINFSNSGRTLDNPLGVIAVFEVFFQRCPFHNSTIKIVDFFKTQF